MNNPDPEDPYDDLSLYAYSRNNPVAYFDPDGRIPILIPIVAGLVGGGLNLATNWSKIKNPWQALGYFGTGAAGGVVSLTNPLAGGAITSAGNATIDIATGNVPDFNNPTDALLYVGKEAAVGAATSFAGAKIAKVVGPALAKLGSSVGGWFKNSFQAYAKESINTIIINGKPITTTIDVGIKATKQYVNKALGSSVGQQVISGGEKGVLQSKGNLLTQGEYLRIENAATRINKPISIVGSRASGTAKATSDWDYVIESMNNKEWKAVRNSLPGSPSRIDNMPRMIDIFKQLDKSKPYFTIYPRR